MGAVAAAQLLRSAHAQLSKAGCCQTLLLATAGVMLQISRLHADQLLLLTLMDGARALLHDAAWLDLQRHSNNPF
jgi:hypothetical protein